MCLIVFAWKLIPQCPLVLAANRDEFFERPTRPAGWWDDHPDVYAGRDLQAGGTWLGIDRRGRIAALTNIRNGQAPAADKRSRGELVANFLGGDAEPRAYLDQVRETAGHYNGFNLLIGDEQALYWVSNEGATEFKSLEPGIYGLSNGTLDAPWPKVVRAKAQFASLLCTGAPDDAYYEMLADTTRPADSRLPDTGVSLEWERLLSPICIESESYGTRASSLVRLHAGGHAELRERVIR
ncbi:MAG: NRDE family protein [Burkholderiaceae bacterium]|nr:NRDE family protein [Burkholderiaceae bacterium]